MDLYNLKALRVASTYEAAEFERELDIRFDDFTPEHREIWLRQTLCLEQYAQTRTYSSAARAGGVTVYTLDAWEREDTLGFVRRKEIADREFRDGLDELLLERARQPDSPPSLLNAVLRAHMPEKYKPGYDGHDQPDSAGPPDFYNKFMADMLSQIQERELASLKNGETPNHAPAPIDADADTNPAPDPDPTDADTKTAPDPGPTPQNPAPSTQNPNPSTPSTVNPSSRNPEPGAQNPSLSRRQRRELQRKQRKPQNSHHARAPT